MSPRPRQAASYKKRLPLLYFWLKFIEHNNKIMLNHKLLCCACFLLLLAAIGSANEPVPVPVPEPVPEAAELLKHINQQNLNGAGQYKHEIEVDNGIRTSAQGNVNGVQGEYDLPGENGPIHVSYTADSTGFHPHIN
ncbi:uncharacterized protein Cpr60D [Drosophila virilis]|uniref:Pupal cuticle protein Edg-78E n=1 Tax=Drosophila virilis TaxID=7244 RepID=B4LML7_DROVI|nr:pupal cuticle protein Edg-78E [Drosophila virilis]EDW60004.2 uncharacterized protein Dvir_GJ21115 [Drosophila virilis]